MITNEQVEKIFKQENIRFTPQRRYIIDELIGDTTHPTVGDIYTRVIVHHPNISRATVYLTLSLLQKHGLLTEIKVNESSHYDPITRPHSHGICCRCGLIVDLPQDEPSAVIKEFDNFTATSKEIIYKGICGNCNKN